MKTLSVSDEQLTPDQAFARGASLFGQGRLAEAKDLFTLLLDAEPGYFQALNALGIIAMHAGNLDSALEHLSRALEINPSFDKANNTMGQILFRLGRINDAEEYFRKTISLNPDFSEAYANLGQLMLSAGRMQDAVHFFSIAAELRPTDWRVHAGHAAALENTADMQSAEQAYRRAAELNPSASELCNDIGACRARSNDYQEAEAWYRKGLTLNPDSALLLNNLGYVLSVTGDVSEAEKCFATAIKLAPEFILPLLGLGKLYAETGRLTESEKIYTRALSLDRNSAPALAGLADTLRMLQRFTEAEQMILKSLEIDPANVTALNISGFLYSDLSRFEEAFSSFKKALSLEPASQKTIANFGGALISAGRNKEALDLLLESTSSPDSQHIWCNIGLAYSNLGDYKNALSAFDRALVCDPGFHLARINRTTAYTRLGRVVDALESLEDVEKSGDGSYGMFFNKGFLLASLARHKEAVFALRQAIALTPDAFEAYSNILYLLNFTSELHGQVMETAREVDLRFGSSVRAVYKHPCQTGGRKIRIGYISPDFREHSVSYFFLPLLMGHNRNNFEIYCYYNNHLSDNVTADIKSHADAWREVFSVSDQALADMIVNDRIDILVDLAGHTTGNRLKVFMMKPAPVQLTWLGYPATTGLSAIDYRLTDFVADPEGVAENLHTEKLLRMKDAFLCYLPPANAPEVAGPAFEHNGCITFGSFNNPAKIGKETLSLWSEVLRRVPGSRLLLKARIFADAKSKSLFLNHLQTEGIQSDRIIFAPFEKNTANHLKIYGEMDIALDTYPYNGTTTTLEALWMGVPVVTLLGERHAGRVGASILSRLDRREWIGDSPDDYIEKAVKLAANTENLKKTRMMLRKQLSASTLCDYHNFAAQVENIYQDILQRDSRDSD